MLIQHKVAGSHMMEKGDIQKRVKDTYCTGVCTSTPRLWSASPKKVEEKKEEKLCLSEWADPAHHHSSFYEIHQSRASREGKVCTLS